MNTKIVDRAPRGGCRLWSRSRSWNSCIGFVVLLLASGCSSHTPSSAFTSGPEPSELEVVVSFLAQHYGDSISNNTALVVEGTLSIAGLTHGGSNEEFTKSLLSQASDVVPVDLVGDFCAKNAKPQPVWPELKLRLPVVLLSQTELSGFFPKDDKKLDGWERFYAKYPKSPGLITVSRVGFNRQGNLAMVYVGSSSHWLAGYGQIYVLRKLGGKWVEQPVGIGPSWIA